MDFENVYQSRFIIYKMLRLRGYDTSGYDKQSKEELNILFQNHSKKINPEIDSLDMLIKGKENSILVKYLLSDKIRGKIIEKQIDNQYKDILSDNDVCVFITKDQVNIKGGLEEYIHRNFLSHKRFIQIFWLNTLLFDITTHTLTPTYRILNNDEKYNILEKFNIEEQLLPNVLVSDPLANFYGVKVGEVVEIKKSSETNGFTKSYRLCIN